MDVDGTCHFLQPAFMAWAVYWMGLRPWPIQTLSNLKPSNHKRSEREKPNSPKRVYWMGKMASRTGAILKEKEMQVENCRWGEGMMKWQLLESKIGAAKTHNSIATKLSNCTAYVSILFVIFIIPLYRETKSMMVQHERYDKSNLAPSASPPFDV